VSTSSRIFHVQCPSCATEFPIDPAKLPARGVAAICSVCMRVFPVHHPPAEEAATEVTEFPISVPVSFESGIASDSDEREGLLEAYAFDEEVTFIDLDAELETGVAEPESEAGIEIEAEGDSMIGLETEPEVDAGPGDPPAIDLANADPILLDVEVAASEADGLAEEKPSDAGTVPAPAPPEAVSPPSRPVFEDLSSFTNEVLAGSGPDVERTRPAPEKLERFGRRDPHERARHLARVLVSDIIAYYPVRYQESLARRTIPEDFADEIQKSYREYVDQVGVEMAESTPYFTEALNHVLGRGEKFF